MGTQTINLCPWALAVFQHWVAVLCNPVENWVKGLNKLQEWANFLMNSNFEQPLVIYLKGNHKKLWLLYKINIKKYCLGQKSWQRTCISASSEGPWKAPTCTSLSYVGRWNHCAAHSLHSSCYNPQTRPLTSATNAKSLLLKFPITLLCISWHFLFRKLFYLPPLNYYLKSSRMIVFPEHPISLNPSLFIKLFLQLF